MRFDVAVIGAGAAGMMCAATAGQRGRRVVLIDHYAKVGEKIRISGGGRCNFTNLHATHRDFISGNPDFCRSALARYTPRDFIDLVERHGIAWHEKTLGQLFCDDSSRRIIDMLVEECRAGEVSWRQPCAVHAVGYEPGRFDIDTAMGAVQASALVVATGGLTVPKIGATPFAYRLAEQFGIGIVPPKPALVPLSFEPHPSRRAYGDPGCVSLDAEASCDGCLPRGAALHAPRPLGAGDPAGLVVLAACRRGASRSQSTSPGIDARRRARRGAALGLAARATSCPTRAEALRAAVCEGTCWTLPPPAQMTDAALEEASQALADWRVRPSGTLGYNKAEVTLGGGRYPALVVETLEVNGVPASTSSARAST